MPAGMTNRRTLAPVQKKQNPLEEMYKIYNQSVEQQAGDYDEIKGMFRNIYNDSDPNSDRSLSSKFKPYIPSLADYSQTEDTKRALANLQELTQSGGLSAGDQQNLRARGISPIRSMYATAQRDLNRQRNLSGGYSPNYGAVTAKMTRDMSSMIADQTDKVNAQIAEMVQTGKLQTAPQYARAAADEAGRKSSYDLSNRDAKNDAARFNAQGTFDAARQDRGERLGAAQGMRDLYGTTPALVNTYGNQSMETARMQDNTNRNRKTTGIQALGAMVRN